MDTSLFPADGSVTLEACEWNNAWVHEANRSDQCRVAYLGDSISLGARNFATDQTGRRILFDGFATSKAIDNPFLTEELRLFFRQVPPERAILFNNGLHGWHFDEETVYRPCYDAMIRFFRAEYPDTPLYLVLSTALRNPERHARVQVRNRIVRELAAEHSLPVIDLYTVTAAHLDQLCEDGIHPTPPLYRQLAAVLAAEMETLLLK